MKELIELQISASDIRSLIDEVVGDVWYKGIIGQSRVAQFFPEDDWSGVSDIAIYPRIGDVSVYTSSSEVPTMTESSLVSDNIQVSWKHFYSYFRITDLNMENKQLNTLRIMLDGAKQALTDTLDDVAIDELFGQASGSYTISGTVSAVTLADSPIYEIVSAPATPASVDYFNGIVYFASSVSSGTITYNYFGASWTDRDGNSVSRSYEVMDASSYGQLSVEDVLKAKAKLLSKGRNPDVLLVNDNTLADIIASLKQVSGIEDLVFGGEIGRLAGLRVVTSHKIPECAIVVIDSKRVGRSPVFKKLYIKEEEKAEGYRRIALHLFKNFVVLDDNSIAYVVNVDSA